MGGGVSGWYSSVEREQFPMGSGSTLCSLCEWCSKERVIARSGISALCLLVSSKHCYLLGRCISRSSHCGWEKKQCWLTCVPLQSGPIQRLLRPSLVLILFGAIAEVLEELKLENRDSNLLCPWFAWMVLFLFSWHLAQRNPPGSSSLSLPCFQSS